jgi:uncharacterized protein YndB with AHSA1/START domain
MEATTITVETLVNVTPEKAWAVWSMPEHIIQWNNASDDWHTPHAENDLRIGGKFLARMAAKDGSMSFDFVGSYEDVKPNEYLRYIIADGRKVEVFFTPENGKTKVTEVFEPEQTNSLEMQKGGWQAILDNFKKYAETVNA